ncbi:polysaccharide biosynthesis tyrosine autokinase [Cellulomonas sp. Sa3CUA2]|uniref:non-specific protein-tyrosine kinase n=1 Tax=Cellulomonas avistercoris TaxID=2762242 RepID=A0ABR8QFQ9_9CELL|nr:polysaccharide biosynthesis tyrosine autokinase [Cellulomonas avistercoris]MBD7919256.1 polysaccharide biosynthesis tyrosine autokinase [Cellulomonas avistercoris]
MELTDQLRAIRKNWWIVVLTLLTTLGAAFAVTARATPEYESTLTFFVAASSDTGTALQADEFAQRRVAAYAGVLTSGRLAERIVAGRDLGLTPQEASARITATPQPDAILLSAVVRDTRPERAHAIGEAIAEELGPLVQELERTDAASRATVSLTVISGPTTPTSAVSPRPALNLGVGLLAGLALGVSLAIARQVLDRTVRTPEHVRAATSLPTLSTITVQHRRRRRDAARSDGLVAASDTGSPRAEAYRRLRTNLTFSAATHRMQVIVVSSPLAGEGKTTTSCNLAIALAESGRRVLLVEADLRRPRVSQTLGLEGAVGLTNVLVGQVEESEVIQQWGPNGLFVLPSGTLPPNPSELLGSDRMRALIQRMRQRFDVVILDTPPALPVTDASIVAAHADSVVLVVRYGHTTREQARLAVESLRVVDAPLAGVIINGAPLRSAGVAYSQNDGRTMPRTPASPPPRPTPAGPTGPTGPAGAAPAARSAAGPGAGSGGAFLPAPAPDGGATVGRGADRGPTASD